jgi:hypothetical protein
MLGEHLQLNDNIENYTSTEQFNTWQEALDTGVRDMVLNTNADCVMKGKWNKPK